MFCWCGLELLYKFLFLWSGMMDHFRCSKTPPRLRCSRTRALLELKTCRCVPHRMTTSICVFSKVFLISYILQFHWQNSSDQRKELQNKYSTVHVIAFRFLLTTVRFRWGKASFGRNVTHRYTRIGFWRKSLYYRFTEKIYPPSYYYRRWDGAMATTVLGATTARRAKSLFRMRRKAFWKQSSAEGLSSNNNRMINSVWRISKEENHQINWNNCEFISRSVVDSARVSS